MSEDVWLIIPTYNEAANVEPIVAAARTQLVAAVPDNFRILIVDDNSPDGTGALADGLARHDPSVAVLHRAGKSGLGQAYLAGFAYALDAGAEMVIEMDADFSHDPSYLPALLEAARTSDVVLGSRYVPGGGVRNWGMLRQFISRGGGRYARQVLGVEIRDLTGGYKVIHRRVLEAIDLGEIRAEGYVFQIEMTYLALLAGFTVTEVPIVFANRRAGTSKMSGRIAVEAMLHIPRLKRESRARLRADPTAVSSAPSQR